MSENERLRVDPEPFKRDVVASGRVEVNRPT
jgi:hypothetical protein